MFEHLVSNFFYVLLKDYFPQLYTLPPISVFSVTVLSLVFTCKDCKKKLPKKEGPDGTQSVTSLVAV